MVKEQKGKRIYRNIENSKRANGMRAIDNVANSI